MSPPAKYPPSQTPPAVPSIIRRLSGDEEARLVWINERGGLTFRAGNRFVKWNPHGNGLDLEAERARLEWAIRWHPVRRCSNGEPTTRRNGWDVRGHEERKR